jgi:hypothetical protein
MKKTLLILYTLLLSNQPYTNGQDENKNTLGNTIYEYDFAGNRISRYVVNLKEQNVEEKDNNNDNNEEPFKHSIGYRNISVYPNPVKTTLTAEIWNGEKSETYIFQLFDAGGKLLIENKQIDNGTSTFDLSKFPKGIYILVIQTNDGKIEYKIIKGNP